MLYIYFVYIRSDEHYLIHLCNYDFLDSNLSKTFFLITSTLSVELVEAISLINFKDNKPL